MQTLECTNKFTILKDEHKMYTKVQPNFAKPLLSLFDKKMGLNVNECSIEYFTLLYSIYKLDIDYYPDNR